MITALIAVVGAFLLSAFLTRQFCDPTSRLHFLDHPNERSLHTNPTPRTGGVAINAGLLLAAVMGVVFSEGNGHLAWLVLAASLVAMISFLDDIKGVSVASRFLGHVIAAGLVMTGGLILPGLELPGLAWSWPVWAGVAFSVPFLVWMINLYNFMDGMDGFAGGMAVIGFGTLAVLAALAGHLGLFFANLAVAAAAAGFLLFNFPPARIFMGDTGSSVLGLLAGGMSLWGVVDRVFPFWAAILAFSPFIVDASVTLVRRLLRGERVWQAHKTHYYQRLVQSGWGHRKTVMVEYGLMLACGASAVLGMQVGTASQWLILVGWCLIYPVLMLLVSRLERRATTPA
jgi:UDP-N-acetylmuramyl pentapeptide phosphotransferase/UDP-N-acetylglucosamine-1-phosphate transferase